MNPLAKILRLTSLVLAVAATPALAGSWSFLQGAYSGGGSFSGGFAGADGNGDGWLSSFDGEVSAFQAVFTGDALAATAHFGLGDLYGLTYRLDGGPLGDDIGTPGEGIMVGIGEDIALLSGVGAAGLPGAFMVDRTGESSTLLPITVTAVPEPASALLLAGGVAALLGRRRLGAIGRAPVPHQDQ